MGKKIAGTVIGLLALLGVSAALASPTIVFHDKKGSTFFKGPSEVSVNVRNAITTAVTANQRLAKTSVVHVSVPKGGLLRCPGCAEINITALSSNKKLVGKGKVLNTSADIGTMKHVAGGLK